jgi:hypothetical protein
MLRNKPTTATSIDDDYSKDLVELLSHNVEIKNKNGTGVLSSVSHRTMNVL